VPRSQYRPFRRPQHPSGRGDRATPEVRNLGGPFRYHDKGIMATIGPGKAATESSGFKFSGRPAWLFIHTMYLARFENRVLVLFQWFWNAVTRNRAARLITGERSTDARSG